MATDLGTSEFNRFVANLSNSGLIAETELAEVVHLHEDPSPLNGRYPVRLTNLTSDLVARGSLTCWQCTKLHDGRWKGFFLGEYKLLDALGPDESNSFYLAEHPATLRRVILQVTPVHGNPPPSYKVVHSYPKKP